MHGDNLRHPCLPTGLCAFLHEKPSEVNSWPHPGFRWARIAWCSRTAGRRGRSRPAGTRPLAPLLVTAWEVLTAQPAVAGRTKDLERTGGTLAGRCSRSPAAQDCHARVTP